MRRLALVLAAFGLAYSIDCPENYRDNGSGKCFTPVWYTSQRNYAYDVCASTNGYMYDINNAFSNNQIRALAGTNIKLWLGLTCLSNSTASCMWDNGRQLTASDYTNFYGGIPNTNQGACVLMLVSSGVWYSVDCTMTVAASGCQWSPGVQMPLCKTPNSMYFRGKCYTGVSSDSLNNAQATCNEMCGDVASIHSEGENSFVRDVAHVKNDNDLTVTGLKRSGNSYSWLDGSPFDYTNFGHEQPSLGSCVAMAVTDTIVYKGKWINSQCSYSDPLTILCKKNVTTECDAVPTTTLVPTLAPMDCVGPSYYTGVGTIYSPGYPRSSEPNRCEYLITEDENARASITFTELTLDRNSYIVLYNSIFDKQPFITLTHTSTEFYTPGTFYSTGNMLKMVFNTTGANSNQFRADFGGLSEDVPTTEMATTTRPCGGYFDSDSEFTSQNYPNNYLPYSDCNFFLSTPKDKIQIRFADLLTETNYDYINIYDGYNRLLQQISGGPFSNKLITVNTNTARVWFHSDGSVELRGFNAQYWGVDNDDVSTAIPETEATTDVADPETTITPVQPCGGDYYEDGTITSPNYPRPYPQVSRSCFYSMYTSRQEGVCITFDTLSIRQSDNVILFDYTTGNEITRLYSYSSPGQTFCTVPWSRGLLVTLKTYDFSRGNGNGFSARFRSLGEDVSTTTEEATTPGPCGGYFDSDSEFTSQNYPNNYLPNSDCTFYLSTSKEKIEIRFTDFLTEAIYDYVNIYDGYNRLVVGQLYGGPCSDRVVYVDTNTARVVFHTDSSVERRGFKAQFRGLDDYVSSSVTPAIEGTTGSYW